jgi:hypothetical protein
MTLPIFRQAAPMSTTPAPETKARPRRRRKAVAAPQPVQEERRVTRACGHPPISPPYVWVAMSDGSTLAFSTRAIERGALCPACVVQAMVDEGLVSGEAFDDCRFLITDFSAQAPAYDEASADRLFARIDHLTARSSLPICWHSTAGVC